MSDTPKTGKVSWKRFGLVMAPAAVIVGGLGAGVAAGAVQTTFAFSGSNFTVTADQIDAKGFQQYGDLLKDANGKPLPVTTAVINHAEITNMCQSVVQKLPYGLGTVTLKLSAGTTKGKPVVADHLTMGIDSLEADAVFKNMQIGQDASTLSAAKKGVTDWADAPSGQLGGIGAQGGFGQQATEALLTNVKQNAYSTTAGTFKLSGLSLKLVGGVSECGK
ncbi:DUF6230 family protein [Actinocorallia lasiicapitis]